MQRVHESELVSVLDYPSGRDRFDYYDIQAGESPVSLWLRIPDKLDRPIAVSGGFWTPEVYVTVQEERYVVLFHEEGSILVIDTETRTFAHKAIWTSEVVEFDSFLVFFGYMELVVLRGDRFAEVSFDHDFGIERNGEAIVSFDPAGVVNVKDGSPNGDLDSDIDLKALFESRQQALSFEQFRIKTT